MLNTAIQSVLGSPIIASPRHIIVADDDSNDDTEEVVRQHGATYLRVNNHNISLTRNAGLAQVETDYVTFLDHDDAWLPGNMQPQLEALLNETDAAFAYGIARCANEDLQPQEWTFPTPPLPTGLVPSQLHLGYPNLGVVLFRREAVDRVGGFDPRIIYHQDGDMMLRVAARRHIIGIEFVGMLHRMRPASRARCDYHWKHREVAGWTPRNLGVGWKSLIKLRVKTRGLLYHRFCQDAVASLDAGQATDAFVCLTRALRISPERGVRHYAGIGGLLWQCVRVAHSRPQTTAEFSLN
jgi:glycosyltransferase involved in cell wall biosynthesis